MKETIRYRVYDSWDEFVVEGTASECAAELGMKLKTFRNNAIEFKQGKYKKYSIFEVQREEREIENKKEIWKSESDLIKEWDDFITPIRKRYGVPVYKPGKGDKR